MTYTTKSLSNTGFTLAANGDMLTIPAGGIIYNDNGQGIYAAYTGTVDNQGTISAGASGIVFDSGGWITNGAAGSIFAYDNAIFAGNSCVIRNFGLIASELSSVYVSNISTNVTLINTGYITSSSYNAYYGSNGIDTVINAGHMIGNLNLGGGNDFYDGRGGTVVGTIDGGLGNDILIGGSGADKFFDNSGSNWIVGGGGDDTVTIGNYGAANGTTTAWAGEANFGTDNSTNDTLVVNGQAATIFLGGVVYDAFAGSVAGWIWGFENATGTGSADSIIGTGGNNIINGGGGADWLVGGGGYDQFVFDNLGVNGAKISDYSHDVIDLHNIDANTTLTGDQAFSYHTTHTSNAAGEMVFTNYGSGGQIDLYVNADNVIDATIYVGYAAGNPAPTVSDFWL